MQLVRNEVDLWSIAREASFPINYSIDQPRFQSNTPDQIDGILLASSEFGQRRSAMKN